MYKDEFVFFLKLFGRVLLVWFLFLAIIYMPILTGIPAFTIWFLSGSSMNIGFTAMWSTKTLLEYGIIPIEPIVLYGIMPAIAILYIAYDTYKWLESGG